MAMPFFRFWLHSFLPLFFQGNDYLALRRFQLRRSWEIATVIAETRVDLRDKGVNARED